MYLEVTFRRGKPQAAYLNLPRKSGDTSQRTVKHDTGLLIDYSTDGRPIGIEIPSPRNFSVEKLNQTLTFADQPPAPEEDLLPLLSAC